MGQPGSGCSDEKSGECHVYSQAESALNTRLTYHHPSPRNIIQFIQKYSRFVVIPKRKISKILEIIKPRRKLEKGSVEVKGVTCGSCLRGGIHIQSVN